jgi:hypothetical protein
MFPAALFAEPAWNDIKAMVKKDIPTHFSGKINVLKIENAKDGSRWMNRDVFPAAVMYTHSGWVYYTTEDDLPGEVTRQRICVNYEKIDGTWVFKSTGIPVDNSTEQVSPPTKIPPLPAAPDAAIAKEAYIEMVKSYFKTGYNPPMEVENLTIDSFEFKGKPVYKRSEEGYGIVTYTCPVQIKYTAIVKETEGWKDTYKVVAEGPAEAVFVAEKKPAKLWYESTKVDKWKVNVVESYTDFHKDQEKQSGESGTSSSDSSDDTGSSVKKKLPGLKKLFD